MPPRVRTSRRWVRTYSPEYIAEQADTDNPFERIDGGERRPAFHNDLNSKSRCPCCGKLFNPDEGKVPLPSGQDGCGENGCSSREYL